MKGSKRYIWATGLLLSLATGMAAAGPSLTWTLVNPLPGPTFFKVLLSNGSGSYVAAGGDGLIYMSSDGSHWIQDTNPLGVSSTTFGGLYAAGVFVLKTTSGGTAHLLTSSDGITWADAINWTPTLYNGPYLAFTNGTFIAFDDKQAATSPDGVTWALNPTDLSAADGRPYGLYAANGTFLTVTADTENNLLFDFRSTDGLHWTKLTNPPAPAQGTLLNQQFYTDGSTFFAETSSRSSDNPPVGAATYTYYNALLTSTDAVHWTQRTVSGGIDTSQLGATFWDGSEFIVTGVYRPDNETYHSFSSHDGLAWTDAGISNPGSFSTWLYGGTMVRRGSGFLAIDRSSPSRLYQSSNLFSWTLNFSATSSLVYNISKLAFLNGQYLAVTGGIGGDPSSPAFAIEQSRDGVTWNEVYRASSQADGAGDTATVVFGGGMYVATDGKYWASGTDGVHWTKTASPPPGALISPLAFANGRFAAFASTGSDIESVTSRDGVTWTANSLPQSLNSGILNNLYMMGRTNLASTGSKFISLGNDTTVFTSQDGVTWTEGASFPIPNGYTQYSDIFATSTGYLATGYVQQGCDGICLDYDTYVAIATSKDGSHWTPAAESPNLIYAFTDTIKLGSGYVAYGLDGLFYGKDATHWCDLGPLPNQSYYSSIAPTSSGFLMAGSGGGMVSTVATEADLQAVCVGKYSSSIQVTLAEDDSGQLGGDGGYTQSKGGGDLDFITLGVLVMLALSRRGGARQPA